MSEVPISASHLLPTACGEPESPVVRPVAAGRILIVMHDFSGGGTERVAIRLANQWTRMGRTVRIFCGCEAGPARDLVDPAVEVEVAEPRLARSPWSRLRLGRALAEAARRFKPDAIFGPGNFHLPVLAAFSIREDTNAATFCKISNPLCRPDRRGIGGWIHRLIVNGLTARLDGLVAMSPALREDAAQLSRPERVAARWEPIFPTGPRAYASEYRDPTLIVASGRLEPQKNFQLAIQAMAHLGRWTDARLVILGEGSERPRLTRLIRDLGLQERVRLLGHVRDPETWLRRASCFLMTSHYEGYPAALVEALASGLPAVVTPCSPALPEIMPRIGSSRLAQPDPGAIAYALENVLRRPHPQPIDPLLLARHDEARAAASYLDLMDRSLIQRRLRRSEAAPARPA